MKTKHFLIACAVLFTSACATPKIITQIEQPTIVITDSNFCVSGGFSASINQDSLFLVFDKGFILGSGTNLVKIYWQKGLNDPDNGQIVVEPNLCISNTDFCLKGQYWVQVNRVMLLQMLQKGISFGTSTTGITLNYLNGKLTAKPTVCIKTK